LQFRTAAVPDEKQRGRRGVSLDQVRDSIVISGRDKPQGTRSVTRGEVELQAGLGPQIGIALDESAANRTAIVAVRQDGVTETARHLCDDRHLRGWRDRDGHQTGQRRV
jgi:hypothetical protein